MIFNIEINISDGNGKLLHRFQESLSSSHSNDNFDIETAGKGFEDFLNEYMSFSGRFVREKLLSAETSYNRNGQWNDSDEETDALTVDYDHVYENSQLEYQINIGNRKLATGKIPLILPSRTWASIPFSNATEDSTVPGDKNALQEEHTNRQTPIIINNPLSLTRTEKLKHIISFAMQKAIEKYECNILTVSEEVAGL